MSELTPGRACPRCTHPMSRAHTALGSTVETCWTCHITYITQFPDPPPPLDALMATYTPRRHPAP